MIRVGVIRGGPSSEYDVSLNTGGNVLSYLRSEQMNEKYKPIDILIDKNGAWHVNGKPTNLEHISKHVDVVFNALHGDFGEDGKAQQMLNQWKIPYTGSGAFASALSYNQVLAKEQFTRLGLKTPKHLLFAAYDKEFDGPKDEYIKAQAQAVFDKLPPPWVVKPITRGSSMGVHVCKTYPELLLAFKISANEEMSVMVEEMIEGKKATVGVIEGFRGQNIYTLPPTEVHGAIENICPGNFTTKEKDELTSIASQIHKEFNLCHYSQSSFIVHPKKGIYIIETNTLPSLATDSSTTKSLHAVGSSMPEFVKHLITLARDR